MSAHAENLAAAPYSTVHYWRLGNAALWELHEAEKNATKPLTVEEKMVFRAHYNAAYRDWAAAAQRERREGKDPFPWM